MTATDPGLTRALARSWHPVNDYPPEVATQLVRDGVDATWLDDRDKSELHRMFDDEIAALDKELVR